MKPSQNDESILLAHGAGGRLSHDLIEHTLLPVLGHGPCDRLDDSAVFQISGSIAFTTDSYVISPLFFPGGDIGRLAVCGTVNDLAMSGASPLYLSLSFIIEEGLPLATLRTIVKSVRSAADEAGVSIVTGDTKVVSRGQADGLFITTSGVGTVSQGLDISGGNGRPGDKVLISGSIGEHGIAIVSQREGLAFCTDLVSDCAPLNWLVADLLSTSRDIHCLRDPTRGGLATTLNELASQSGVGIAIEEEHLPVSATVTAACEMLGLDPLYVANEGKLVAVVDPSKAEALLATMKRSPYGRDAALIGELTTDHPGRVTMKTTLGPSRIIDMLSGEPLPRIC